MIYEPKQNFYLLNLISLEFRFKNNKPNADEAWTIIKIINTSETWKLFIVAKLAICLFIKSFNEPLNVIVKINLKKLLNENNEPLPYEVN